MYKREDLILQHINRVGKANVNTLAEQFSVSIETIRRDLNKLGNKGLIYRTHGGTVSCTSKDIGRSFQSRQRFYNDHFIQNANYKN